MASRITSAGGKHVLAFGEVSFEVDAGAGGRITSFRLGDIEALTGPDVDPDNYGSTLWSSPQSDWGWPPPREFARSPVAVSRDPDTLTLVGPPHAGLGVRLEKRFSIDRARSAVTLEYSIHNVSAVPKTYSPWEVSRVPPGGLTFFPTGAKAHGPLAVERRGGMTWYAHEPEALDETGQKHSADGERGYVAHAHRGLLYVKTFLDLPPARQAPDEGEVEVYGNCKYVEVELQGPYAAIPPGAAAVWTVQWFLRRLEGRDPPAVGMDGLRAQAERLL